MKSKIHEYKKNKYKIMSKNIVFGMMLLFVTLSTQAQEKKNKNANYNKMNKYINKSTTY